LAAHSTRPRLAPTMRRPVKIHLARWGAALVWNSKRPRQNAPALSISRPHRPGRRPASQRRQQASTTCCRHGHHTAHQPASRLRPVCRRHHIPAPPHMPLVEPLDTLHSGP
jgi:hypothetical protein